MSLMKSGAAAAFCLIAATTFAAPTLMAQDGKGEKAGKSAKAAKSSKAPAGSSACKGEFKYWDTKKKECADARNKK